MTLTGALTRRSLLAGLLPAAALLPLAGLLPAGLAARAAGPLGSGAEAGFYLLNGWVLTAADVRALGLKAEATPLA
jgi:hypothetical protein